ncbi:response regulator [candidate division KSB1 bacterium]
MKFLLIDDDLPCISNLKDVLESGGHECALFQNPIEGIAALKKDHFEIALIDFKMPLMNGLEVLRSLKTYNPEIFTIIITGYAETENTIDALNMGAYAFFQKPININKFMTTIKTIENELNAAKETENLFNKLNSEFNNISNRVDKIIKSSDQILEKEK